MMNFISNDRTSAYLYKELLRVEYQNMFSPAWMSTRNFIKLIEDYDKIDFKKINIDRISDRTKKENGQDIEKYLAGSHIDDDICFITVDGKVEFVYDRYVEDSSLPYPAIGNIEENEYMFVPDIKAYVKERYYARLVRMLKNNEEPIFIFNEQPQTTEDELYAFMDTETPYKKVLFTSRPEFLMYEDENTYVEVCDPELISNESYMNCAEFVNGIIQI